MHSVGISVLAVTGAMGGEPGRWRTLGEREIYRSPYTWLGQMDVELPVGERFWHDVIRLHRAAAMVLVDDADRVLMLWRHRFVMDQWGWELPGGLVDEDEEPAEAAQRELEEETGYRAGQVEQLIAFQPRAGTIDGELFAFVGRDPERIGEPTEVNEVSRLEWVPLASVPQMITAGDIWNAGSLVPLLRFLMGGG